MRSRVQKWGNSLALRIPQPFAKECGLSADSTVEVSLRNGKLVIVPIESEPSLEDLVKQITPRNRHQETQTGSRLGDEIW